MADGVWLRAKFAAPGDGEQEKRAGWVREKASDRMCLESTTLQRPENLH